jgi:shikimate kinase
MNIVLTGFMGTGKSFIGKAVARKLGWEFFDVDEIIEKEAGMRVHEIFARKGEKHFRGLEANTIRLLALTDKSVIATGGGAVLRVENMEELERNGIIICLTATPETIYDRTKKDGTTRPLLNVPDPVSRIKELLDFRKEYYNRCHLLVDNTNLTTDQVVDKILTFPQIADKLTKSGKASW